MKRRGYRAARASQGGTDSSDSSDSKKRDPLWYKDAIIYELRVRSFFDSNGDGIGDFHGVAEKLDYLQDLGVTALWLLPFYPSPQRDDGYDIADYTDVHPDVGTLADFKHFLDEAHSRGLYVITELVLNHTSDQHPWFQRARRAPAGSPERDFYVWSDTPERYLDARIIFKDFEPSNWAWDPVARSYFWHRFFSHQPDLNFENPAVHAAMLEVVDFWFELGVDGLRLDAVPYLYEEDGTNCENLPKTHAFLKKLRAHVDERFPNRMLLAEANQWPEDAASYFGDGDECHMNFHFPIMPRMFMSIHMEDRFPIIDILAQTPALHPSCQWAMFLRNHDELTLEMVTDEERDYMYKAYAHETSMRINLGIRRRLAPLVGNDRRKMELLNGLLLSLPGTPVLYYGDEIGMGDNVYLGDRNGVRTPMQWSADRNAGFSRTNPQRLILPIIIDPEYHYESLNVEAQNNNPNSLLWWMKRIVALRQRYQAFGRGTIEFLSPHNARVLAFIRQHGDETILVVANLSRFVQFVELDLSKFRARVPNELFGRTKFPAIGDHPYLLTLGAHAFYWFALETQQTTDEDARASLFAPAMVECTSLAALLQGDERALLEDVLPSFLETRRWFAGRERTMSGLHILEALPLGHGDQSVTLLLARVEYAEGDPETYLLPLAVGAAGKMADGKSFSPLSVVAHVRLPGAGGEPTTLQLIDAAEESGSARVLLDAIVRGSSARGSGGELVAQHADTIDSGSVATALAGDARVLSDDDDKTALQYDDKFVLKLFRRVEDGRSPELEVGLYLGGRAKLTALIAGSIEYRRGRLEPSTLAVLQAFVPSEGTAWRYAREEVGRYFERVLTSARDETAPAVGEATAAHLATSLELPPRMRELMGAYRDSAMLLGQRTAELHLALGADTGDAAFTPEPYSALDRRSKYQSLRNVSGKVMRLLRSHLGRLPARADAPARAIVEHEAQLLKRFEPFLHQNIRALRIRCHGDLHLGQVLYTGKDFVFIDFDGDRERPLAERRRKRSPLKDAASMLRSFHYAAFTALVDERTVREGDRALVTPWAHAWQAAAGAAFMRGYLDASRSAPFLPPEPEAIAIMLDAFVLEKALYELEGELRAGADTVWIPLHALAAILGV